MNNKLRPRCRRWAWRIVLAISLATLVAACSPYASVSIGVPFNAGPFYVNPSIGIGGFL